MSDEHKASYSDTYEGRIEVSIPQGAMCDQILFLSDNRIALRHYSPEKKVFIYEIPPRYGIPTESSVPTVSEPTAIGSLSSIYTVSRTPSHSPNQIITASCLPPKRDTPLAPAISAHHTLCVHDCFEHKGAQQWDLIQTLPPCHVHHEAFSVRPKSTVPVGADRLLCGYELGWLRMYRFNPAARQAELLWEKTLHPSTRLSRAFVASDLVLGAIAKRTNAVVGPFLQLFQPDTGDLVATYQQIDVADDAECLALDRITIICPNPAQSHLNIWDLSDNHTFLAKCILSVPIGGEFVSFAQLRNNRFITISKDGFLRVWVADLSDRTKPTLTIAQMFRVAGQQWPQLYSLAVSDSGRIAVSSIDGLHIIT